MYPESRLQTFPTPSPVRVRIAIPQGNIRVVGSETNETRVELTAINGDATARARIADAIVAKNGDEIVVLMRKVGMSLFGGDVEAVVHAPRGSAAILANGSGRIETRGPLSDVSTSTAEWLCAV
jgi:hypothetical protein